MDIRYTNKAGDKIRANSANTLVKFEHAKYLKLAMASNFDERDSVILGGSLAYLYHELTYNVEVKRYSIIYDIDVSGLCFGIIPNTSNLKKKYLLVAADKEDLDNFKQGIKEVICSQITACEGVLSEIDKEVIVK